MSLCNRIEQVCRENNIGHGIHAPGELELSPHLNYRQERFRNRRFNPTLSEQKDRDDEKEYKDTLTRSALYCFLKPALSKVHQPGTDPTHRPDHPGPD